MKGKIGSIIFGAILIGAGLLFLASNLNLIPQLAAPLWAIVFGVVAISFLGVYLFEGYTEWGWLFPAFILGGVAAIIYLGENGQSGPLLGSLILWCVGAPFLVAFLIKPKANWWALIPAWVMAAIGILVLISDQVQGEWVAIYILMAVALPFLFVFLWNRRNWWALIPAFSILIPVFIIFLTMYGSPQYVAAFVLLISALPFLIVAVAVRKGWWAWIPTGILSSIAVMLLLSNFERLSNGSLLTAILFSGWTLTFAWLWLRRHSYGTDWAKYPTVALGLVAILLYSSGSGFNLIAPIVLFILGGWLILRNFGRSKTQPKLEPSPTKDEPEIIE